MNSSADNEPYNNPAPSSDAALRDVLRAAAETHRRPQHVLLCKFSSPELYASLTFRRTSRESQEAGASPGTGSTLRGRCGRAEGMIRGQV